MCEVKVYLKKDEKEELLLEDVILVSSENDQIFLKNIFGEEKKVKGKIKKIDMGEHKIFLENI
jgi:predicted RNA-binding protein